MEAQAPPEFDGPKPARRGPRAAPTRAGRFDLVTRIGVGGMASVYLGGCGIRGPRRPIERVVAVKVMHPHLASDEAFVKMFMQEARLAASVQHPNVVGVLDVGRDDELLYAAMDYVEGDTLASIQATAAALGRAVPLGVVLRVVLDALAGLDAVHDLRDEAGESLDVVHRDVTPHNLLIGTDGVARLTDFGVSRARGGLVQTQLGVLKGKPAYMAPEQLEGGPVDRRADLFAMGVTLWEALTLRRLFPPRADNAPRGPYPSLREFHPSLPPALDVICRRALAHDPAARFPTAAAFGAAIERELRGSIAPARELGGFIAAVAHAKIERERDALRAARARGLPSPEPAEAPGPASFFEAPLRRPVMRAPTRPGSGAFFPHPAPKEADDHSESVTKELPPPGPAAQPGPRASIVPAPITPRPEETALATRPDAPPAAGPERGWREVLGEALTLVALFLVSAALAWAALR